MSIPKKIVTGCPWLQAYEYTKKIEIVTGCPWLQAYENPEKNMHDL